MAGTTVAVTERSRWGRIRLFAMDVDGVVTDGTVTLYSDGKEAKTFSILDGLGITRLLRAGVEVAWISGRPSEVTTRRAAELGVEILLQGRSDKDVALREILETRGISPEETCFLGDDLIDLPAMELAGIGIAVPNAVAEVKTRAEHITGRPGGAGAVREVCDLILQSRNQAPGNLSH